MLKLSHAFLKLSSSTMVDVGPGAGRSGKVPWSGKNRGSHCDQLSCAAGKDTSYKEATLKSIQCWDVASLFRVLENWMDSFGNDMPLFWQEAKSIGF